MHKTLKVMKKRMRNTFL